MLRFGIIGEGICDQVVIENVLLGYFQEQAEEPVVNYIQPPFAPPNQDPKPGGWTLVFNSISIKDPERALQFNDYLVIHIDADVQEEAGFDVPRCEGGKELSVDDRIDRIANRLRGEMNESFWQANAHRVLFAIAVDAIECWILPMLCDRNKAKKTAGCLTTANYALRKRNRHALSAGGDKFPKVYEEESRHYRKKKVLLEVGRLSPSLNRFISRLEEVVA